MCVCYSRTGYLHPANFRMSFIAMACRGMEDPLSLEWMDTLPFCDVGLQM